MRVGAVAMLLFGSGFCALIYQTTWFREFRLIFGVSTAASAAVLAIFMGGLGLGGALLGRRADRSTKPLGLYAGLELGIAISAAATPLLLILVRAVYLGLGGSSTFGTLLASGLRLLLASLVLILPTVLMGGTLPAAARAVETGEDVSRRRLAVLYGFNTLGAVTGAVFSTFFMLEVFGNRFTLWMAALLNLFIAIVAWQWSERSASAASAEPEPQPEPEAIGSELAPHSRLRVTYVFTAAAAVGFAFFLMEIVWYRMLAPLLGGSTYTFGMILAIALTGIGLGGLLYSVFQSRRAATFLWFSGTCAAEALALAIPYALGDRLAILAILLRPIGEVGFHGFVGGWWVITAIVILPAAIVAGFQFPLLIGLLGRGDQQVGYHAGMAYAWNTAGAIVGALVGGFGILPFLTALGTWKLVVVFLAALSLAALAIGMKEQRARVWAGVPVSLAAAAVACLLALGPTAVWRHSPIGAGRADRVSEAGGFEPWMRAKRRSIVWQIDGVESTVALSADTGYAFLVAGKSDGHARADAGTQVMAGLVGTAAIGDPKRAFVVGLGTGSTAGWLARVPSMERVDVAELEPGIVHVAEVSTPVNADVLRNPKVRIHFGDAREMLLTGSDRYDLIFSEPSNPYRAGVASLFTREFYSVVADRLEQDGVFVQWLQAYEIESSTIRSVYATLLSVFPNVQTWQSQNADLLLLASPQPIVWDRERLRRVVETQPYRTAMHVAWRMESAEGFLSRFIATSELAHRLAAVPGTAVNTDDRNRIEFEAARAVGRRSGIRVADLRLAARQADASRPPVKDGVDWTRVDAERLAIATVGGNEPIPLEGDPPELQVRARVHRGWTAGRLREALTIWNGEQLSPLNSLELAMAAEMAADAGDPAADSLIERLALVHPIEADAVRATLLFRRGLLEEAVDALSRAFVAHRSDPWPLEPIVGRALGLAMQIALTRPDLGGRLHAALAQPFSVRLHEESRNRALFEIARILPEGPCNPRAIQAMVELEPWVPWGESFLRHRAFCYGQVQHPLAERARRDLEEFLEEKPEPLLR